MDTLKRRMEQLLNGRFEYEVPKLTLSDTQINLTTNEGENVRGELYVAAEDNRRIKGMTMSSNRRVLLAKEKFSGTTVCIPYGLDVKGQPTSMGSEYGSPFLRDLFLVLQLYPFREDRESRRVGRRTWQRKREGCPLLPK